MVSRPDRSQSETIGVILLTAVVVVVTTTAGVFILSDLNDRTEDDTRADIDISPTASGIVVEHRGGDECNASDISVVVRGATEQQFVLAEDFAPTAGSAAQFVPGQRWEQNTGDSYDGELTVLVVDTEAGKILEQTTTVVGSTGVSLSIGETRISDEEATNYTVTETFEQDEPKDVTDEATISVANTTVLTADETTTELVGDTPGTTTVTATVNGTASNTVEIAVVEAGTLTVTDFSHDNPVTVGDVLNITVTVENEGETEASGAVQIQRRPGLGARFEGAGLSRTVTLDGGEQTTVEFDYEIRRLDAAVDQFDLRAVTPDDSVGRGDTIETRLPEPAVQVDGLSVVTTPPFVAGQPLTAEVTLTNTGEKAASSEPLNLSIGGVRTQTTRSGLGVGQTRTIQASVTPPFAGSGLNLTASTAADNRTTSVDVFAPANFTVSGVTLPAGQPLAGESLRVDATIENTGGVEGTQTVRLDGGSLPVVPIDGDQTVTLSPGEQTTVTLTGSARAAGSGALTVRSDDDHNSTTVTILEPAYFELQNVPGTKAVVEGNQVSIGFDVVNTGEVAQTQRVTLGLGGTVVDSETVSLTPGKSQAVTLNYDTEGVSVGTKDLTVATENESEQVEVDVQSILGGVTILSTNAPVEEGETLEVTATTGGLLGNELQFSVDGTTIETISNPGGEVTFSWQTERGDAGGRSLRVDLRQDFVFFPPFSVGDDTETATVTKPTLDVTNLQSPPDATVGENLTANATVSNEGQVTTAQQVELRVGENPTGAPSNYTVLASQSVELAAGTQTAVAFENVSLPSSLSTGSQSVGIVTETNGTTAPIDLLSGTNGAVASTGGVGPTSPISSVMARRAT